MPLARIITESVDDSLELAMQLCARGFLVETVSPDQVPDTPADLEVRMEECSPEEVLNKAAGVSENEDLWVFVAPGALDERARPIRTIPLLPHAFDVPLPRVIPPKFERKWPVEAKAEEDWHEVVAPQTPGVIPLASGNGGAQSERVAALKEEPATVPPVIAPGAPAKQTPDGQPPKVKVVVLPKLSEVPAIPEIPRPAEPILAPAPSAGRVRLRAYKVSFQTGARVWKRIAVSGALAVVVGLLVAVVALRPHSPPAAKPSTGAVPTVSSAGVKSSKQPTASSAGAKSTTAPQVAPAVPHSPAATIPQGAGRTAPQFANSASKPTAEKGSQEAALNSPAKQAAAAVANNPNRAQPVRRHTGSPETDIVAEDTVVFYDRKRASPGKTPQEAGVKR